MMTECVIGGRDDMFSFDPKGRFYLRHTLQGENKQLASAIDTNDMIHASKHPNPLPLSCQPEPELYSSLMSLCTVAYARVDKTKEIAQTDTDTHKNDSLLKELDGKRTGVGWSDEQNTGRYFEYERAIEWSPTPQSSAGVIDSSPKPDRTTIELESTLLTLFQSLTEMQVAASSVQPNKEGLAAGAASKTLDGLFQLAEMKPRIEAKVPMEVLDLIDQDKNPHQFTRNKIEEAVGSNQYSHGKLQAVSSYHSLLEKSLLENFPELLQDEQPTADLTNDHTEMKVEEPIR